MKHTSSLADSRLRDIGKRVTSQRRIVMDILASAEGHLDASEIYERARQANATLSLATVYRTLKALCENGVVRQLHLAGERHHYELDREDRHAHLVCSVCGRIWEVDSTSLSRAARAAGREFGFQVTAARMEVVGVCASCRNELGQEK